LSNIAITHADTGVIHAEVIRSERISPNFVRVTLGGDDLERFEYRGFDQWFRLAIPVDDGSGLDSLPATFGVGGYLKYLTIAKNSRPVIRNYTVRDFRRSPAELDIDFVVHGIDGIAAPWSLTVEPGAPVAFIDQGVGWKSIPADSYLLVGDEAGLPAIVGILRDLPRDAVGHAIIEIPDASDRQQIEEPAGIAVDWIVRDYGDPGVLALAAAKELPISVTTSVFVVGESSLATGLRRWAVDRGVPKSNIVFSGYYKLGKAAG
jgi:NADPH-dependent ferric siderophore reductase